MLPRIIGRRLKREMAGKRIAELIAGSTRVLEVSMAITKGPHLLSHYHCEHGRMSVLSSTTPVNNSTTGRQSQKLTSSAAEHFIAG